MDRTVSIINIITNKSVYVMKRDKRGASKFSSR
jgi:hypothetical protein